MGIFDTIKRFGLEAIGLYYSSYPGYVVNNKDPEGRDRLLIIIPTILGDSSPALWAPPSSSFSGKDYGSQVLPQNGELIWVEFQHGKLKYPLWKFYPHLMGTKPKEFSSPNIYGFKSPKGHIVFIDDDLGLITIKHKEGTEITLDKEGIFLSAENIINISNGKTKIQITEDGINIDSNSSIYVGGDKPVLYAKVPGLPAIADVSQIGVSLKVKVG